MIKYTLFLLFILFSPLTYSEINSKEMLSEVFYGCVNDDSEEGDWLSPGQFFEYCGCYTNEISKTFTIGEVMRLAGQMENQNDLTPFLLEEKVISAASICVTKLFE